MENRLPAALIIVFIMIITLSRIGHAHQHLSPEQERMSAAERNHVYAPWDPANIDKLRKEVGLSGPGPQRQLPMARSDA